MKQKDPECENWNAELLDCLMNFGRHGDLIILLSSHPVTRGRCPRDSGACPEPSWRNAPEFQHVQGWVKIYITTMMLGYKHPLYNIHSSAINIHVHPVPSYTHSIHTS